MAAERNPYFDAFHIMMEPYQSLTHASLMHLDLYQRREQVTTSSIPTLLVPGAGALKSNLFLTKKWYQKVAGFHNTTISSIATLGPLLPEVTKLIHEAESFDQPINAVGFSVGGLILFLAACEKPELFHHVAIVDAPIKPIDPNYFNAWMRPFAINDLLTNPEMNRRLSQSVPDRLTIRVFATRDDGTVAYDASVRQDVPITDLGSKGHNNLYYNIQANTLVSQFLHNKINS